MNKLFADLGLSFPIIQSPMAGVQGSALAAAVSGAGGLGSLPCALLDLPSVRNEITVIREQTPPFFPWQEQVWLPYALWQKRRGDTISHRCGAAKMRRAAKRSPQQN